MILTPIAPDARDAIIDRFADSLLDNPFALRVFRRIAQSGRGHADSSGRDAEQECWHADAKRLATLFGMDPMDEPPQRSFSWDGRRVRAETEPAVLFHEVAHFQLASPERRKLFDFGLGAGPETGLVALANHVACVDGIERETEEAMASLLGILWETVHDQPALRAFEEQNWFEGAGRPGTSGFFCDTLTRLRAAALIDDQGEPLLVCRTLPDA
ncbi:MAG TPA: hypothetical protein VNT30_04490 [Stellaceae bacterium]|nr:hypothetical protein [Stellaceae bacterium]